MEEDNKQLLHAITTLLNKCFGNGTEESLEAPSAPVEKHAEGDIANDVTVSKAVDEELKQATFLVLAPEEVDLHGDIYSETEIRKGCHNFQTHCRKANLFHLVETEDAAIVENYIAPADFYMDSTYIKKGSWLQVWQFNDDELWDLVQKGEINGVSIQCMAGYEELDNAEG